MDTPETSRWYRPTPGWLVLASLAVTGLLWLSNWLGYWHKGYGVLMAVAGVGVVLAAMAAWWLVALVFRLRFQFSIRSLLALVVAVALPFSWLDLELKNAREQGMVVAELRTTLNYDWEFDASETYQPNAKRPWPAFLRNFLGDQFFADPVSVTFMGQGVSGKTIDLLARLPHLKCVSFRWRGIDVDNGVPQQLEQLSQIRYLDISDNELRDTHLQGVKTLVQLQRLYLSETMITDRGLKALAGMRKLKQLDVSRTDITDAGLEVLRQLTNLELLDLSSTRVTGEGVQKLQEALPNCKIEWNHSKASGN
jgi:hypothetical protein